jgi:hypothetical protein
MKNLAANRELVAAMKEKLNRLIDAEVGEDRGQMLPGGIDAGKSTANDGALRLPRRELFEISEPAASVERAAQASLGFHLFRRDLPFQVKWHNFHEVMLRLAARRAAAVGAARHRSSFRMNKRVPYPCVYIAAQLWP